MAESLVTLAIIALVFAALFALGRQQDGRLRQIFSGLHSRMLMSRALLDLRQHLHQRPADEGVKLENGSLSFVTYRREGDTLRRLEARYDNETRGGHPEMALRLSGSGTGAATETKNYPGLRFEARLSNVPPTAWAPSAQGPHLFLTLIPEKGRPLSNAHLIP